MKNQISFSQAVEGYILSAKARHLSPNTIKDYLNTYRKFQIFLGDDPPIAKITSGQIERFLGCKRVSKKRRS